MSAKSEKRLIVYGADYCGQARLLARTLKKYHIEFEWRDIGSGDARFRDELKKLAHGYLSVPTVVFPDGKVMVEPWPDDVLARLGEEDTGWLDKLMGRVKKSD